MHLRPPVVLTLASTLVASGMTLGVMNSPATAAQDSWVSPQAGAGICPTSIAPTALGGGVYQIDDSTQLQGLRDDSTLWDDQFVLAADIDLDSCAWSLTIGDDTTAFTGTFDGAGFAIDNINITRSSSASVSVGLFGQLGAGHRVTDLHVSGSVLGISNSAPAYVYAGGLAGYVTGGVIDGASFTGSVTATQATPHTTGVYAGGLVGWLWDDTITNSAVVRSEVTASRGDPVAGGLVGKILGGLSSGLQTWVTSSYAADVRVIARDQISSGGSEAGGIAGGIRDGVGDALVEDVYSTGVVSVERALAAGTRGSAGGIVGVMAIGTLTNAYSTADIRSVEPQGTDYLGRLVGYASSGAGSGNFWDSSTRGPAGAFGFDGGVTLTGTGVSRSAMESLSTFSNAGWDIVSTWQAPGANTWGICEGQSYPYLLWQFAANPCSTAYAEIGTLSVDGQADLIYISGRETATVTDDTIYVGYDDTIQAFPPLAGPASTSTTLALGAPLAEMVAGDDSLYVAVYAFPTPMELRTFPIGAQGAATPTATMQLPEKATALAVGGGATATSADDSVYVVFYNGTNGVYQMTPTLDDSALTVFTPANVQPLSIVVSGGLTTTLSDDTVYVGGNGFSEGSLTALPPALDDSVWRDPLGYGGATLGLWDDSLVVGSYNGMRVLNRANWDDSVAFPYAGTTFAVNARGIVGAIAYNVGGFGILDASDQSVLARLDLGYPNASATAVASAADGSFYVVGRTRPVSIVDRVAAGAMSPTSGDAATIVTLPIDVASGRLMADGTVTSVRWGGTSIPFTRVAGRNAVQVSVPANSGTVTVVVELNGGDEVTMGTFVGPSTPTPSPTYPPSAPRDVVAIAGDASASVTWLPPASSGSFTISDYQVRSIPGDATCTVVERSCEITGLTNGTAYSFEVRALNGAGWGPWSDPSDAVTPSAPTVPSLLITGSRDGSRIAVRGSSEGFGMGAVLRPWVKLRGQQAYTEGAARILVDEEGDFEWGRRTGKRAFVIVRSEDRAVASNRVIIPART